MKSEQLSITILAGLWAAEFSRPPVRLSILRLDLLHRIVNRESVSAFRFLGDDGIRSPRHQGRNRAVVILDVQLAVARAEQLADFGHHPLLILFGFRAGRVAGEN